MSKQTVQIGSAANDGTGDPLRTAFDKINDNFQEVYDKLGGDSLSNITHTGSTITNTITNGDITIDPNGTGTVFINGPLEVRGDTTEINTTQLQIEDNLLELNRNSSGGDVDAGIFVNRGAALNSAFFYWNEGEDKWKAVLSTSDDSVTSAVTDTSTATIVANLEGDTLQINEISSGDSTAVHLNDNFDISGTLFVSAIESSDSSEVTINNLRIQQITANDSTEIQIEDAVNISGTLSVNTISTADSTGITLDADLHVNGTIRSESSTDVNIDGGINVTGNSTIEGDLQINGGITADGVAALDRVQYDVVDNVGTSATALALTKGIHIIAAGETDYTLAAGTEGQVMHFVLGGGDSTGNAGATTTVTVSQVRDPRDQDVLATYAWNPFTNPGSDLDDSTTATRTLATCVFAAGSWHLDNFVRL